MKQEFDAIIHKVDRVNGAYIFRMPGWAATWQSRRWLKFAQKKEL